MKVCRRCKQKKDLEEFTPEKRNKDGKGSWCRPCVREYSAAKSREKYKNKETRDRISRNNFINSRKNPEKYILNRCRSRAKKQGLEFNLTIEDIVIPAICPLLEIPIALSDNFLGKGKAINSSPSIDKINPKLGYIKGNIKIISNLANMVKSNATEDQIRLLAKNIGKYING